MTDLSRRFAYCESVAAVVVHIRGLTKAGKKLGGGADSHSLCGMRVAWDLATDFDKSADMATCRGCIGKWRTMRDS